MKKIAALISIMMITNFSFASDNKQLSLETLPSDILFLIAINLDLKDLNNLSLISKKATHSKGSVLVMKNPSFPINKIISSFRKTFSISKSNKMQIQSTSKTNFRITSSILSLNAWLFNILKLKRIKTIVLISYQIKLFYKIIV